MKTRFKNQWVHLFEYSEEGSTLVKILRMLKEGNGAVYEVQHKTGEIEYISENEVKRIVPKEQKPAQVIKLRLIKSNHKARKAAKIRHSK